MYVNHSAIVYQNIPLTGTTQAFVLEILIYKMNCF